MPHNSENPNKSFDTGLRGLALLDAIILEIEAHKEHWKQSLWATAKLAELIPIPTDKARLEVQREAVEDLPESCGTAFCVAGWAAHLTGAQPLWKPEINWNDEIYGYNAEEVTNPETGYVETIERYASKVLGLNLKEASYLFEANNSLDYIKRVRDALANGEEVEEVDYS